MICNILSSTVSVQYVLFDGLTNVSVHAEVLSQSLNFKKCEYMKIIEKRNLNAMIHFKFIHVLQLNMKCEMKF